MGFEVGAEAYGRFMGRFSEQLAGSFLTFAGVAVGDRVLDVGCGPGALTARLVALLGAPAVTAIDPSESFVRAARERLPGVDIGLGTVEELPYPDATFDAALAQLVVHHLRDPVAGLTGMARVVRPGGTVAACVWDHSGGTGPLAPFWTAVHDFDPDAADQWDFPGSRAGHLTELFGRSGLVDVDERGLTVEVGYSSFTDWWESYELGVGPVGEYVAALSQERRRQLRQRCSELLGEQRFSIAATAWAARGSTAP